MCWYFEVFVMTRANEFWMRWSLLRFVCEIRLRLLCTNTFGGELFVTFCGSEKSRCSGGDGCRREAPYAFLGLAAAAFFGFAAAAFLGSVTLQRYNAIAFRGSFQEVSAFPDSQTEVSKEVWFYWALFCGSPGIICTWGKKKLLLLLSSTWVYLSISKHLPSSRRNYGDVASFPF